jgi:hypothetical protein
MPASPIFFFFFFFFFFSLLARSPAAVTGPASALAALLH